MFPEEAANLWSLTLHTSKLLNIIMDMGRFQTVAFWSKMSNIFNAEQKVNETMFQPLESC